MMTCARIVKIVAIPLGLALLAVILWKSATLMNWNPRHSVGDEIDRLNGVAVFYNGGVGHSSGRSVAADGYNLGLKYQCVEFVKRYYHDHLKHRMPDSYGHAKQFFDPVISDGELNPKRDLIQYTNGSRSKPQADDLLIFGPSLLNPYGHVAIISTVNDNTVEIVQQNPGPFGSSRELLQICFLGNSWRFENERILGWLRLKPNQRF